MLTSLLGSPIVFAADGDGNDSASPANEEGPPIELSSVYPIVEGIAGETFKFDVSITPATAEYAVKYDFNVVAPPGWKAEVWRSSPDQHIGSIDFGGKRAYSDTVVVKASSLPGKPPELGEYVITLEMVSGELKGSIDLTAVVTARYEFDIYTVTGRLNTEAKGGEETQVTILLENTGTTAIDNVTLSSDKPEGWSVIFNPDKIDSLEPDLKQEVEVVIKPPKRTIARDYIATLKAESENSSDSLKLRVTVQTPRVWGGAGIGLAVAVIAGLIVLFRRLSMR